MRTLLILLLSLFGLQAATYTNIGYLSRRVTSVTPSGGSGTTGTAFITNTPTGTLHNDSAALVGMRVNIATGDILITALGRYKAAGNSQSHSLAIYDYNSCTALTNVTVTMSSTADADGYVWATLSPSFRMTNGVAYYVFSQENNGGDQFYYDDWVCATSGGAGITTSGYKTTACSGNAAGSYCFGPVNFKYTTP